MVGRFEPAGGPGGGAAIALDRVEISILRSVALQLLELIGPDKAPGDDPLDALFTEGPSEPPADPALARLFPDAYGEPGTEADEETRRLAAEFRRYTEDELRAGKRENLLAMIRTLDQAASRLADGGPEELDQEADGGLDADEEPGEEPGDDGDLGDGGLPVVLTLDPDECARWLRGLNDMRLALAVRLDITDEDDLDRLFARPPGHPTRPMAVAYLWLGRLQESLVETLLP
jgi:hypothetical protein